MFCQFTEEMDILEKLLTTHQIKTLRLDGSMTRTDRDEMLKRCDQPDPPVTLIQIKAGGVGLNLQAFSRVYIMSPDWNPCNEIQAMARAHRIGQTRKVMVKRIVLETPDSNDPNNDNKPYVTVMDERIMAIQVRKRNLMADLLKEEQLRCNGKRNGKGLTRGDMKALLK